MKSQLNDKIFLRDYLIFLLKIADNKEDLENTIDQVINNATNLDSLSEALFYKVPYELKKQKVETTKLGLN